MQGNKNCVACAEEILENAALCKHCGTRQDDSSFAVQTATPSAVNITVENIQKPSKKRGRLGCGTVVLVLLVVGYIGSAISGGEDSPQATSSSSNVRTASPTQAPTTKTPDKTTATSLSSVDCAAIKANITMVRTVFSEGTASASQVAAVLDSASLEWEALSAKTGGSRAAWLNKMAELSTGLKGFILNGSPSNGPLLQDQLGNNFGLATQVCG